MRRFAVLSRPGSSVSIVLLRTEVSKTHGLTLKGETLVTSFVDRNLKIVQKVFSSGISTAPPATHQLLLNSVKSLRGKRVGRVPLILSKHGFGILLSHVRSRCCTASRLYPRCGTHLIAKALNGKKELIYP